MATTQSTIGASQRQCRKCLLILPISEFYRNRCAGSGGLQYRCKACCKKYSTVDRMRLIKRDRHGRKVCRNTYTLARRNYKLTPEEYDSLIDTTDRCQICEKKFKGREPFIDHCHKTNRVRGLLCARCNTFLSHLSDDPAVIQRAIAYLRG